MYFIQLPVKNKFSYKENSTLTEKTHNKERLLREEGGALLIYSNPLFQQMKRNTIKLMLLRFVTLISCIRRVTLT